MHIAIRTDASARIGLGHLARCRTLAQALRKQGAFVHFICRAHPGHQIDALRAEGYRVCGLPAPPAQSDTDADYAAWLGVSQAQDATETLAALTNETCPSETGGHGEKPPSKTAPKRTSPASAHAKPAAQQQPDWLIVDHYALDATWEQRLRPAIVRILAIDDLANRRHDCDLLLDQNLAPEAEARYAGLLPASAQCLLGPSYALLRPEYAATRQGLARCHCTSPNPGAVAAQGDEPDPLEQQPVRRVLIFFGGTDPDDLSGRALEALSALALSALFVDLVIGANNPHRERLTALAQRRGNTQLHSPRPHLADLMAEADLAIGAGGTTTWERCCLGLPSLVISIAENQRPTCAALADAGLIDYLGHQEAIGSERLRLALQTLIAEPARRQRLATASAEHVDGQGVPRVIQAMQAAVSMRREE
ncbi:UDP-2,4-diacetamido-2,4,6-trideoxy-beta-L-altropyranose hydrolase [Lamprobacter modestohalophilus]|uniref:UDP-2,4-diacetamido-2,4, 6-trideoxy-beta-L-altropyranose hydrolase n=1 Tax=Lamprobacter modestohalophilus TaxID=1064514 RepID=UPI002ADEF02B|nr:UDP-2,4-diacetamido-2,4,6-trideoxy-beta-L-altropyranose hydrolase [Lamprobacter modestohalophilus]MEA1052748.1 UDP-2,4-diacetamido-2,4,6-trideoxy-beta-L-altropyranose hydrolase [Lamprobacter modestohalophilus]